MSSVWNESLLNSCFFVWRFVEKIRRICFSNLLSIAGLSKLVLFKVKYWKAELVCANDAYDDAQTMTVSHQLFESVSLFPSIQRLQITSFMLLLWIRVGLHVCLASGALSMLGFLSASLPFSCQNSFRCKLSILLSGLCKIKLMCEMVVLSALLPPGLVESCCVSGQKWAEENQHCDRMPVKTEDLSSVCG